MNSDSKVLALVVATVLLSFFAGCEPNSASLKSSSERQQELEQLRAANRDVKKLRAENQEIGRLRTENQEIKRLRGFDQEIARLQSENKQMRKALAAVPARLQPPPPEPQATNRLPPIENLARAFEDAALVVASQGDPKPEDTPQEGDNILIDQSVIGLLIPEFQDRTNGGPYEVSGWLASRSVVFKNYQQLNFLGLTNYNIRRAPPKPLTSPTK